MKCYGLLWQKILNFAIKEEVMKYNNDQVRRRDRLLTEQRAIELIEGAEYGVLSMTDEEGMPYAIPVNHVWDGESALYVHCAPEGKKLRAIAKNPHVCLCIVGDVNLLPANFTTEYESVVIYGLARTGLDEDERMKALHLLINKLSPEHKQLGEKYTQASFHRTEIIKIEMQEFSGKCKKVNKAGRNQAATGNKSD